jgi:hypothetical protein
MAIFSFNVICWTSARARSWGDSAVLVQGRAVVAVADGEPRTGMSRAATRRPTKDALRIRDIDIDAPSRRVREVVAGRRVTGRPVAAEARL